MDFIVNLFTDWSLIVPFVVKGIVATFIVAFAGFGIANIHAYHDPDDDKE